MPDQPASRRRLPPLDRAVVATPEPAGSSGPFTRVRAATKLVGVVGWTVLLAIPIQAVLFLLPGRLYVPFARTYWRGVRSLLGVRVRALGEPVGSQRRPVLYACSHSSWLDIAVLGGTLEAPFVSKDQVAGWPLISTVAKLGRTVFVTRSKAATGRERDEMRARLLAGDSLILFPEGTSNDGSRVLPFRSSFFAVAEGTSPPPVQPVSVVYDRLDGLPVGRAGRPTFAWYGDMDLGSHAWQLAQCRGMRATVLFHPPLDPAAFPNRKALAQACWDRVAEGAAALRQNRPAQPATVPTSRPAPTVVAQPAQAA